MKIENFKKFELSKVEEKKMFGGLKDPFGINEGYNVQTFIPIWNPTTGQHHVIHALSGPMLEIAMEFWANAGWQISAPPKTRQF